MIIVFAITIVLNLPCHDIKQALVHRDQR